MPLYELLCLARPALSRADQVRMMQRVGALVMDRGGVLTGLTSYGEQHLAYDIRKPFQRFEKVGPSMGAAACWWAAGGLRCWGGWLAGCERAAGRPMRARRRLHATRPPCRAAQAHVWQANFVVAPGVLRDVNHELSMNKDVLRWVSVRRDPKSGQGPLNMRQLLQQARRMEQQGRRPEQQPAQQEAH